MNKYKIGIYTNPLAWIVGVGIVSGCLLESIFGGTARNIKKVFNDEDY